MNKENQKFEIVASELQSGWFTILINGQEMPQPRIFASIDAAKRYIARIYR